MQRKKVLERKGAVIEELARELSSSQLAVLTDYRGLTVSEISNLRRKLRDAGVSYHVTKNTLTRSAAEKVHMSGVSPLLAGPTAIAFAHGDLAQAAKALRDFAKSSKEFTIKGGLLNGRALDAAEVANLADLPSREVLVAKVLGLIQSPMTGLVTVLNGPVRNLAYVLHARAQQLEEAG